MTAEGLRPQPTLEEGEEALLGGDEIFRSVRPGTAHAALRHREFRVMWLGSFASNIGTWMQTVVLGAYAYDLTGSATFVGLLTFANLGPMLLLSLVGGAVADAVDRRRLLIGLQSQQLVFSALLAVLVMSDPSRVALFACVTAIGIGNALNAPAWTATLPSLVGREDLAGAISLNSTMVNGSRVIGPAIGSVIYAQSGASWVFAINAVTYLAVIGALLVVRFPPVQRTGRTESGWRRMVLGFEVARQHAVVGRILVVLPLFSFFCLPFIGLFAVVASQNLDIVPKSTTYGLVYATFGLGACLGALSVGTIAAGVDKMVLVRRGLFGFGVSLAAFALTPTVALVFPVVFVLGFVYFMTTTSMLTVLQLNLDDDVRGRVMALWLMGFGGTVSVAGLVFGPIMELTSARLVLLLGAAVAGLLAWWCDLLTLSKPVPTTTSGAEA